MTRIKLDVFKDSLIDYYSLIDIGGKEWIKINPYGIDIHRIYFNDLWLLYGLSQHNEDFILDNKIIPEDMGRRLKNKLNHSKFWYDINQKCFDSRDFDLEDIKILVCGINKLLDNFTIG